MSRLVKISILSILTVLMAVSVLFIFGFKKLEVQIVKAATTTTVEILTGSVSSSWATSYAPFNTYYHDSIAQSIYLKSDLEAAGLGGSSTISEVCFQCSALPGTTNIVNMRIKMQNTTSTSLSAFTTTSLTTVYGPTTYARPAIGDWKCHTLATPFTWDGTSNLLIEAYRNDSTYVSGGGNYVRSAGSGRTYAGYCDSCTGCGVGQDCYAPSTRTSFAQVMSLKLTYASANPSPNIPTLVSPSNGTVGVPLLPNFQFGYFDPNGDNGTKLDLMIDNNSNFSSPEINVSGFAGSWLSSSTINYSTSTLLSYNTKYYWRARVFDGTSYSPWSDGSWNFTTLNLAPNIPTLVAPSNGVTTGSLKPTLQFSCSDPNGDSCTRFDLQINDQPFFDLPLIDIQNYAGSWANSATIPYALASNLSAHTAYYWRARIFDGTDWSSWSDGLWNFVTPNQIPTTPLLVAPESGMEEADSSLNIEFKYSDPDADPCTKFDLQVSTSSAFTSTVVNESNHAGSWPSGSNISYSANNLPYGNKYYWRARIFDGYDWSGWSGGSGLNLANIIDIAAGSNRDSCSVSGSGSVYCWGRNYYGELGNNTTIGSWVPVQVFGLGGLGYLTDMIQADGGVSNACAVKSDGTVYCWGYNGSGILGNGTTTDSKVPVQVLGVGGSGYLTGVEHVFLGDSHVCSLKSDGTVWCWGSNAVYGQLGNNTTTNSYTPVQVKGVGGSGFLAGVEQVTAGIAHNCAVKSDGTVYCWGRNYYGELGNNSTTTSYVPVQVVGAGGAGYLTDVDQISGQGSHSCAVKTDGTIWCWGYNYYGNLGNNSNTDSKVPVQVLGVGGSGYLTGVIQSAGNKFHSCVVEFNGTVYCWGNNGDGQLGNNSTTTSYVPVQVKGAGGAGYLTGAEKVVTGDTHSCAIKSDGTTWCWGSDSDGQLGKGAPDSIYSYLFPVQVLKGAAQPEDVEVAWNFTTKIEPQKFTIKKADGCSCSNAEECYSGSCGSSICGSSGPSATNLIAPDAPEEDSSNYCSHWLNASNGNSVETGNNGAIPFKWTYADPTGKHLETYYMRISTSSDVDVPNPTVDQNWTNRTEGSGSDITQQISVKINPGLNELAYGQTYNWWVKVCNEGNAACSGWTKALSSFSTPVKHYPIVNIAWNKKVLTSGEAVRFCTTAEITNENDPCYSTCWTGPASSTPEVGDSSGYWKCSVCYNSSNQKQACQDVPGTQYSWYFPGIAPENYEFQSSTSAISPNPLVKFKTTGKSKTVKLNVTGSCCGGYGSVDIVQPIPKWKETSPF